MLDVLLTDDLLNVFCICFFSGFGLSLSAVLIATLWHLVKDILFNSI